MPAINSKKLLQILKKRGFFIRHQIGSHLILKHEKDTAKRVTLPMHNKDLKPGTLNSILKQSGVEKKELYN